MKPRSVVLGLLALALSQLHPFAVEPEKLDCGKAQTRPHGCEYSFTLSSEEFVSTFGKKEDGTLNYRVPLLKVYDKAGVQVFDRIGYAKDLVKALQEMTASPTPVERRGTLADELARVRTSTGATPAASGLARGDFYVVTYEADWCEPCKAQLKDVRWFADSNRKTGIEIVRVGANFMTFDADTQKRLAGHTSSAPKPKEKER
ncbi:MAG TPA: hypothetical protein VE404_06075 [Verrucomicrobiae bacterium]|nr:hypothetical protein [Verrucomicrobiae bacterium]